MASSNLPGQRKPNQPGRPSIYTDELARTICTRIALGETLISICREPDMPNSATVFAWRLNNAEFSEMYVQARQAQADFYADQSIEIADDATRFKDSTKVMAARLRFDTRRWLVSKLHPRVYGDRIDLNHGGKVQLTDEQLDARIAELVGKTRAPATP